MRPYFLQDLLFFNVSFQIKTISWVFGILRKLLMCHPEEYVPVGHIWKFYLDFEKKRIFENSELIMSCSKFVATTENQNLILPEDSKTIAGKKIKIVLE